VLKTYLAAQAKGLRTWMDLDLCAAILEEKLRELELDYLNSNVKVTLTRDIPKLEAFGEVLTDLKSGAMIRVRRWVAEKLVEAGAAQHESPPITPAVIRQIEWRERNNPADLQKLPDFFYQDAWNLISVNQNRMRVRDPTLHAMLLDLASLRIAKILRSSRREAMEELLDRLTPEERLLQGAVWRIVEVWQKNVTMPLEGERQEVTGSE